MGNINKTQIRIDLKNAAQTRDRNSIATEDKTQDAKKTHHRAERDEIREGEEEELTETVGSRRRQE